MGNQIAPTTTTAYQQNNQHLFYQDQQQLYFEDQTKPCFTSFAQFLKMVILRNQRGGSDKVPVKKVNSAYMMFFFTIFEFECFVGSGYFSLFYNCCLWLSCTFLLKILKYFSKFSCTIFRFFLNFSNISLNNFFIHS